MHKAFVSNGRKEKQSNSEISSFLIYYSIFPYHIAGCFLLPSALQTPSFCVNFSVLDKESKTELWEQIQIEETLMKMSTDLDSMIRETDYKDFNTGMRQVKFFDLIICDERLRYWRRLYLQYHKANSNNKLVPYSKSKHYEVDVDTSTNVNGNNVNKKGKLDHSLSTSSSLESLPTQSDNEPSLSVLSVGNLQGISFPSPSSLHSPYRLHTEEVLHVYCSMANTYEELCSIVRSQLALPTNLDTLLAAEDNEDNVITKQYLAHIYKDSTRLALSDKDTANIHQAASRAHHHITSEPVRVDVLSNKAYSQPYYPLLICAVRRNIIYDVFSWKDQVSQMNLDCVNDGIEMPRYHYDHYSLQTLDPIDIPYLTTRSSINPFKDLEDSFIISGFYFTLYGSSCEVCEPNMFSGPFITYLKASDTYQSFVQRIAVITGDSEMGKYRLAVISRKKEVFLISKPTSNNNTADEHDNSTGDAWLWECFAKRYQPNTLMQVETGELHRQRGQEAFPKFAWLGIQRSTADVVSETKNSFHALK